MAKAKRYTTEYKEQAVRLAERLGSAVKAARHLGISEMNVYHWKMKSKQGKLKDLKNKMSIQSEAPEEELKRLRKENEELKQVNYILKRAAAFFSQDHLK